MLKCATLLLFTALAVPSLGLAQQLPMTTSDDAAKGTPEERTACAPDVRKLCSSLKADAPSTAYADCLKANRSELSKACDAVFKTHGM